MGSHAASDFTSAALAVVGTAVDMFAQCAKDPQAAAVLGASTVVWLGPLGVAAGAVAGIGANRLASALDRRRDAQLAARDLLVNGDIARAQAAAVAARIRQVRGNLSYFEFRARSALRKLALGAETWWLAVVHDEAQRWLKGVNDREFVETLTGHLSAERRKPPGEAAWLLLLAKAEKHAGADLDDGLRKALATELSKNFVNDSFNAIRSSPRAFASVVLRFLAEVLTEVRRSNDAIAGIDAAAKHLVEAAEALDVLRQVPEELQRLAGEIREVKLAAEEGRDAAFGAQQASERTEQLVLERLKPATRIPFELPPAANKLFGRDQELAQLRTLLLDPHPNCYVVGVAGMGKTALAADAVVSIVGRTREGLAATEFPDGVLFIDAYKLHRSVDAVCSVLVETLAPGLLSQGGSIRAAAERACRSRKALVVLEGAEELHDGLGALLAVLGSNSKRLILTRTRAQATSERLVDLERPLVVQASVELLQLLAPNAPPEFLKAVAERLGGHPYALTLAGNQLGQHDESPSEFSAELQRQHFPVLTEAQDPKHTLEWLFARSLRRLSDEARTLLAACGCVALAPLSIDFAKAALGDTDGSRPRAALKELVRHSWLRLAGEQPETWEFTHVLAFQFAQYHVTPMQSEELSPTLERLADWARHVLASSLSVGAEHGLRSAAEHALAVLARRPISSEDDSLLALLLYDVSERSTALGMLGLARRCASASASALDSVSRANRSDRWSRERAAAWSLLGNVRLEEGDLAGARGSYEASRQIAETLAASDPTNGVKWRDLSVSIINLGDVQLAEGDLAGAHRSFEESERIRNKLVALNPTKVVLKQDLSLSLDKLGDVQFAEGDLPGARRSYEESKEIRHRLAALDPTSAELQRDVSVSLNKLGDVQRAGGDLAGARRSYEESKEIRHKLAASDPKNAGLKRDLSVSLSRLGNVQLWEGDLAGARRTYEASTELAETLAASDPINAGLKRDLSVSLSKLGYVLLEVGDLAGARRAYEESKEIRLVLAASDPTNAGLKRDLSVSLSTLGDVQLAEGDLAGSRRSYEASKEIYETLAVSDPTNAGVKRDLSVSLSKLGDVQLLEGDLARARRTYEASKELAETVAASDPTNAGLKRDLSVSLSKMGYVLLEAGDLAGARRSYEESKEIRHKLAAADPTNAGLKRDLSVSISALGDLQLAEGDLAGARRSYEESKEIRHTLAALDSTNAGLKRDLSVGLSKLGNAQLAEGDVVNARASFRNALEISEALVALAPSNAIWRSDVELLKHQLSQV
ncbi:MAG: tetratricopeptide repeat protein [Planctomycetaceae bacterium]|nr:tetratricopeptide repeat protein [Planctomycetaceae bacterium]